MAKAIMIQGTMSNAGKSLLSAGLCRIFKQDGYKVAPFKAQNMALNSYITEEGLEMGRAQVVQAEACGIKPSADMNPILLKPTTDMGSQVICQGKVVGNMHAMDYYRNKLMYVPMIQESYERLAMNYDIIVIEGAGSPAEINLKQDDIVNMGMAKMADAPVLLVGDIDLGGVFAQLIGTVMLLEKEEQARIKGLIVNKFRGDRKILEPGIAMLEERAGKPVFGVVPYMDVDIEDEDSLSYRLEYKNNITGKEMQIDVAVIRFPKISNFTDFQALSLQEHISLRYVTKASELLSPDVIILPGTKNTIQDMEWLKTCGLATKIMSCYEKGTMVFGICGGYQMLGNKIKDELGVEGKPKQTAGLKLLPIETIFLEKKKCAQISGKLSLEAKDWEAFHNRKVTGYEIHMGETYILDEREKKRMVMLGDEVIGSCGKNVFGTYLHGIFDEEEFCRAFVKMLCDKKGIAYEKNEHISYQEYKEKEYDKLASILRDNLDMDSIYQCMGIERKQ